MSELSRRGFIMGLGAVLAAPAIVRADSLMKIYPEKPTWLEFRVDTTIHRLNDCGEMTLAFDARHGNGKWVRHIKRYKENEIQNGIIRYPLYQRDMPLVSSGFQLERGRTWM